MTTTPTEPAIAASRQASLPPTSLILCSRNRPELLAEVVASVLKGNEVPAEMIIVDQSETPHSSVATLTTDRPCRIRYRHSRSVGLSRANNEGIAAAQHDLFVFAHDDVAATLTWFGTLVRTLVNAGPRTVVTGRVLPAAAELPGGFAPSTKTSEAPVVYTGRIGKDVLYPMNMALYRSAIPEVGGFDERLGPGTPFPAAEDNDLGFRLLEAGYRILYVPEAVLYHRAWRSEKDYVPLRWSYGRGQGAYYAKYLSLRDRYMLGRMARGLLGHLYQGACQARWQRRRAYGHLAYVLAVLSGAGEWLLKQRSGAFGQPR
jgi:GT2 family glycosyltransferase